MANITDLVVLLETAAYGLQNRILDIQKPYTFTLWLTLWLLLIVYMFQRKSHLAKRRHEILSIRNMQFEIRKTLKREQLLVKSVTRTLQDNMANGDQIDKVSNTHELKVLRKVVWKMNNQLVELEMLLNEIQRKGKSSPIKVNQSIVK